ncbi:MAG: hypothetical protein JWO16_1717, partial [Sphingomonas bacterium]|nr:hypothetical protein [Sphingomonas bacterium]
MGEWAGTAHARERVKLMRTR